MTRGPGALALGVGIGLGLLLLWFTGGAVAAPTPVGNCTTLDAPGSYELVGDVSNGVADPCIEITASDVVLDGAGHTVDGAGSGNGTGIDAVAATGLSNVTVRNVTVTEFGLGIRYQSVSGGVVANSTVANNGGIGVLLRSSDNASVLDSTVASNAREGVRLTSSPAATVDDVQVTGNANTGINVASGSPTVTITDSTVDGNHVGIGVAGSDDAHVETTTVGNNSLYGVSLEGVDGTHLESVTATDNGAWALFQGGAGETTTADLELDSATVDTTSRSIALGPVDQSTAPPSGTSSVGGRVNATDTGAGAYLLLNVSYASTTGVDESSLRLWRHDGSWTQLPAPNGVDTVDDYVYANVTSFPGPPAEYAALGDDSTTTTATPTTPTPTATPVQTVAPTPVTPVPAQPVPVDDCVDIDQPGVYELQGDLLDRSEDVCIDVQVGGVTFDGAGHTIDSDGSSSIAGVRAAGPAGGTISAVTVRNLEVSDWEAGVLYGSVTDGAVRAITPIDNTRGVDVEDSTGIIVAGVDGVDNGEAGGAFGQLGGTVRIIDSSDSVVRDVDGTPSSGAVTGITVSGGTNVTVSDVAVDVDGGWAGIMVATGSDHVVRSATVVGPATDGINAQFSNRFELHDSSVADTTDHGVSIVALNDARVVNVTVSNSGTHALKTNPSVTNLTVREFELGAASAPTTVDATGDSYTLTAVPSPPADPGGERNLSRYVEVGGTNPSVLVNVSYTVGDVSIADVDDTTIDPWIYDGGWSQATGTAGTNTAGFYVYANVTSSDVVVAPLGEEGSGASITTGDGFGPLVALVAILVLLAGLARRP